MSLVDDLIGGLEDANVKDVRIGPHWCAVESRRCGLAMTMPPAYHKCFIAGCGELAGRPALELAQYAKSWNLAEASVGVAAINSLIEPEGERANIFRFIHDKFANKDNKIAVIGHFPDRDIDPLREIGDVQIIEKNQQAGDFPDTAAEYLLPKADIVMITGTALINKSMERLLELSRNAFTAVLGPTTPMSDVLFDYGADAIGGARVKNPGNVLRKVSQGAHTKDIREDIEFLMRVKGD
ncbi:MAG: hypothetical protein MSIBF_00485 [Candidatus Altiarchaeales archaeon IMC4]|nr:MAG: hypothetical protein MSIBF_00485 [Candidatus Altiarchaeales archaeon IMC4]